MEQVLPEDLVRKRDALLTMHLLNESRLLCKHSRPFKVSEHVTYISTSTQLVYREPTHLRHNAPVCLIKDAMKIYHSYPKSTSGKN